MVKLESEKLYKSYLNLVAIKNAISYVQKETSKRTDDGFLKTIGFPYIGKLSKDRKQFIGSKMDLMLQSVDDLIVICLVSDFEKIVFDRVDNASGEIIKITKQRYNKQPFKEFSTDFIKTLKDIDKLSIVKAIISPKLPKELEKRFAEIIKFRNRLAHGKRFGEQSLMSFDDITQT